MRRLQTVVACLMILSCLFCLAYADSSPVLTIGVFSADMKDPRLEYMFLNRWPDGKIVYVELNPDDANALQVLSGATPDLMVLPNYSIARYQELHLIENLYDQVFSEYPESLAEEAEHLMVINGFFLGIPRECAVKRWTVHTDQLEKAGLPLPEDDWTWEDFITKYYEPYDADALYAKENSGLLQASAIFDKDWNLLLPKYVDCVEQSIIKHLNNPSFFLTDDFLTLLEYSRQLSLSDATVSGYREDGSMMEAGISVVFEPYGSAVGPYRKTDGSAAGDAIQIKMPVSFPNEQDCSASVMYYCLMKNAPNRTLAVECLRMMASDEYQSLYYSPEQCFAAREPVFQIISYNNEPYRQVVYSDTYHANIRVVDNEELSFFKIIPISSQSEVYNERLRLLKETDTMIYDQFGWMEIKQNVFIPAMKEFFQNRISGQDVAQLLYQRIRLSMQE